MSEAGQALGEAPSAVSRGMKAVAQEPSSGAYRVLRAGAVELDEGRMELRVAGQRRPIEAKPLALLRMLLTHPGEVVSKRALIEAAWGNATHSSEASLTTAMSKLRAVLGEPGRGLIGAVHGAGYRIESEVQVVLARRAPPLALNLAPGEAVPGRPQWRLDRLLGDAALNDVWLARHEQTREARVFKFADSPARLASLRREARISAALYAALGDRRDLVRCVEWQFEQRPWFIESPYGGEDLLAWAARGELAALALEQRIGLLAQLARALAAAHAAGIVHGDIKPANILVRRVAEDGPVQLCLADFGAGRLEEARLLHTLTIGGASLHGSDGRQTGTLRYMAPEVLAGAAPTQAADIFALGILLFQFLSGDLARSLAIGWEEKVPDPLLRADIEAAAAGDPAQRLTSAALLAERLEALPARRLALEAQRREAALAGILDRQSERARARRPFLIAAIVSLVAGLALATVFALVARHERDAARGQAARLEAVNRFLTDDLLGRGNPGRTGKPEETLMEAAVAAEADIDRRLAAEPVIAGSIYLSLGRAFQSRGAFTDARAAYRKAIAAFAKAGPRGAADLVIASLHQAIMETACGESDAIGRARALIGAAASAMPDLGARRDEAAVWLAAARATLATLGSDVGAAQAGFHEAAERAAALPALFDRAQIVSFQQQEAFTYLRQGNWAEARARIEALLRERVALNGPDHPFTLRLRMNLAQVRLEQGEAAAALSEDDRLLPRFAAIFGADHQVTLSLLAARARALDQLGHYREAMSDALTIESRAVSRYGANAYFAIAARIDAARAQCRAGAAQDGVAMAHGALEAARVAMGEKAPLSQAAAGGLAFCLIQTGQAGEAAPLLEAIDGAAVSALTIGDAAAGELRLMRAEVDLVTGNRDAARQEVARAEVKDYLYLSNWQTRLAARLP
jgi:DNA-binding winged helix-turn-helix (wHTH) protein